MSKLLVTKYKTPTGEYTYATMSVLLAHILQDILYPCVVTLYH